VRLWKPVAEGSLRLNGCYEDMVRDGVNGCGFRRWRGADGGRTDAVAPALTMMSILASSIAGSHSRQQEVITQFQSRVVLGAQKVNLVSATLTVPKCAYTKT